jgi:UDP-3-O-[3-hydroxymyristoyl] glucosamine N-acyltransferase
VAGSSVLGDNVVMAGQSGIADHVVVGRGVILMAQSGVGTDLEQPGPYGGAPARERMRYLKEHVALSKLPELLLRFAELQKKVEELQARVKG